MAEHAQANSSHPQSRVGWESQWKGFDECVPMILVFSNGLLPTSSSESRTPMASFEGSVGAVEKQQEVNFYDAARSIAWALMTQLCLPGLP